MIACINVSLNNSNIHPLTAIPKSAKRISVDDITLQGLKGGYEMNRLNMCNGSHLFHLIDPGSTTGTSSKKKVSLPQFFKREEGTVITCKVISMYYCCYAF